METPLGAMSFEQILAQADANMKKDKGEANPAPKSFADMVEEAQRQLAESMDTKEEPAKEPEVKQEEPAASAVPTGLSFEDLFNQAQERTDAEPQNAVAEAEAKAKAEAEAEAKAKAEAEAKEAEAKAKAEAEAKAKAEAEAKAKAEAEAKEAEAKAKAEAEAKAKAKAEAEAKAKAEAEAKEAEAKAKAEAEAKAKAEAEAKAKAEAEAKAKAKEAAEPLPDTTDSYRVEIPGKTDIPAKEEAAQETGSVMEALFTKEEIEAFRKDIRTLVRAEFKAAMVGAVKDLLSDFNG